MSKTVILASDGISLSDTKTLEETVSSHSTSISNNATAIALKANSSDVYTKTQTDGLISTEASNRDAAISIAANAITSTVAETYATKDELNETAASKSGEGNIIIGENALITPPISLIVNGASTQASTPTPDAPVPILSVDDLALVTAGKNILDPSFLTRCGWTESNGQYTGTPKQLYQGLANHILPVACAANTQYTFAWYQVSSTNTSNSNAVGFKFVYSDGTQSENRYTDLNHTFSPVSAEGKTVVGLRFSYVSNPTLVVKCVQLVPLVAWSGSIEENYQPYITPTTVPDLLPAGTSLRSLPNGTRDQLNLSYLRPSTRAGWAWYSREMVKRCDTLTLDGTQQVAIANWRPYETSIGFAYAASTLPIASNDLLSDKLRAYQYNDLYYGTVDSGLCHSASSAQTYSLFVRVPEPTLTTKALVNAYLAENPITVQYPLATPITTVLDPIELPSIPTSNFTAFCSSEITPYIYME